MREISGLTDPSQRERPDLSDQLDRYAERHQWLPDRPHRGFSCNGDVDAFGDESLYRPSQLGWAEATPTTAAAGSTGPLTLAYTAGPDGVAEGATITFVMRGQNPLGVHTGDPMLDGPSDCACELAGAYSVRLTDGELAEGNSISLRFAPFTWTPLAGRREFKVVINRGAGRPELRLPEPVVVDVAPAASDRLEATVPCTRSPGCDVTVRVTARDRFDNRVAETRSLHVCWDEAEDRVWMQNGLADCQLRSAHDGVLRAVVTAEASGRATTSNPCVPSGDLQLFVGDLHCHDFLSEAEGYPDEVYRWAIEDRRLDFVSVVPQSHGWHDNETWTIVKYMNERYLDEGRFVTFLGFEWQHVEYGDKVVHFLGGDQPFLPKDDPRYSAPAKLYTALRGSDALVISHHPCYPAGAWCSSTDYEALETDVERLIELWSMHGSSEGYDAADRPLIAVDPSRTAMAALRQGLRVGFVAGSDTHSARPGGSAKEPRPYWGGLAAVWSRSLTRRDLFSALRARRTYALTGARIVLRMAVNGAPMGSEIPPADEAHIRIDAWAPADIRKVEIMKDAQLLQEFDPSSDACHLEYGDRLQGSAFYHCRVTQADGHLAVCSPVWVG
jgi:hypothetical protein